MGKTNNPINTTNKELPIAYIINKLSTSNTNIELKFEVKFNDSIRSQ